MTTLPELVGDRIAEFRGARGMSQETLGEELEPYLGKVWPKQAVSSAENGRRQFTVEELVAFCAALQCTCWDLLRPRSNIRIILPSGRAMRPAKFRETVILPRYARIADTPLGTLGEMLEILEETIDSNLNDIGVLYENVTADLVKTLSALRSVHQQLSEERNGA